MIIATLFAFLILLCCLLALVLGGTDERWGASIVVAGSLATTTVANSATIRWHVGEWGIFDVDLLVLLGFVCLMLVSKRFWPIWASSFQLLSVLAHFGAFESNHGDAIAFAVSEEFWGWLIIIQISAVSVLVDRRKKMEHKS